MAMHLKPSASVGTRTYQVDSAACFRTSLIRTVIPDEEFQGLRVSQVTGHRRMIEIQVATLSLDEVRQALSRLQNSMLHIEVLHPVG